MKTTHRVLAIVIFLSALGAPIAQAAEYRIHVDGITGVVTDPKMIVEIVNSVNADNSVKATVQRKTRDTFDTKAIASLGVYLFRRVDALDMNRGPVPTLSVGVEVAESPDYFAGVGLDWPSGLTVSLGITRYSETRLAPGWSEGQTIPLKEDGTPVIASPVTTTSTAIAPYIAIQFRPTIFSAFSKLFKPGT